MDLWNIFWENYHRHKNHHHYKHVTCTNQITELDIKTINKHKLDQTYVRQSVQ